MDEPEGKPVSGGEVGSDPWGHGNSFPSAPHAAYPKEAGDAAAVSEGNSGSEPRRFEFSKKFEPLSIITGERPAGELDLRLRLTEVDSPEEYDFRYIAVARKSPNVLGGETRGSGRGPCHGTTDNFRSTILLRINFGRRR
jgi:hypothetical protein